MGEFELIQAYFASATCAGVGGDVALGIGDDCALLAPLADEVLATSTDTLVAGVHFPELCDPFLLGQRSLAVAASDLAAMGASPIGFTLALTLPSVDHAWLAAFARGLDLMAGSCDMRLIGGDTTRGPLSLTITVFGSVPTASALRRKGARVGDLLCVGGELGDAAGALPLVLGQRSADTAIADALLARYWSPEPQLALGQALRGHASAALDISDGLVADCGHIAKASGVALVIEVERVPRSAALRQFAGEAGALECALSGGDDYRLAFTLAPDSLKALQDHWSVSVIGRVEAGQGVRLVDALGQPILLSRAGYNHFGA